MQSKVQFYFDLYPFPFTQLARTSTSITYASIVRNLAITHHTWPDSDVKIRYRMTYAVTRALHASVMIWRFPETEINRNKTVLLAA